MNLSITVGKDNNGNDVVLDLEKQNVNLILLLGSSGSGKSIFQSYIYSQLIAHNSPAELGFRVFDNTRFDLCDLPARYVRKRSVLGSEIFNEMRILIEDAQNKRGRPALERIVVHIEECDQFQTDQNATEAFYREFLRLKKDSNITVVYSTSRLSKMCVPNWLLENADLKVVFNIFSPEDHEYIAGKNKARLTRQGERYLILKDSEYFCVPFEENELPKLL